MSKTPVLPVEVLPTIQTPVYYKILKNPDGDVILGIDQNYIFTLRRIGETVPIHIIPYMRSHYSMCVDGYTIYYATADNKISKLTQDSITTFCSIRTDTFHSMTYSNGRVYVTTDVGIQLYSQEHGFIYLFQPVTPYQSLTGIVDVDQKIYVRTESIVFSIDIQTDGMLENEETIIGVEESSYKTLEVIRATPSLSDYQTLISDTLCFSSGSYLCFYSLDRNFPIYKIEANRFSISENMIYLYTPLQWTILGPFTCPEITGFQKTGLNTYQITGTGLDKALDVFFGNEIVEFDANGMITTNVIPITVSITNGLLTYIFYPTTVYGFEYAKCMSYDTVYLSGSSLNRVTSLFFEDVDTPFEGTDETLTITAPPLVAGIYPVYVHTPEGIKTLEIEYVSFEIFNLSKTILTNPEPIVITGKGLQSVNSIKIGGISATFYIISNTEITLTVPSIQQNVQILVNENPYDAYGFPMMLFYFSINSGQTFQGRPGDILTITGNHLSNVFSVFFGDISSEIVSTYENRIRVIIPYTPSCFIRFNKQETRDTTNRLLSFTLVPYEINEMVLSISGQIMFQGKGLMNVKSILFGTIPAYILSKNYTQLVASVPEQENSRVILTLLNETTTLTKDISNNILRYTYLPSLIDYSPSSASVGDTLFFKGKHLSTITEVWIGTRATITQRTEDRISALIPPGSDTVEVRLVGDIILTQLKQAPILFRYVLPQAKCFRKDKSCPKTIYSYPANNLSTKQQQAMMIRNHKKVTYNNSRLKTIYNQMLGLDYVINRNLLFRFKYTLYSRYLNDLVHGNITQQMKTDLNAMIDVLVSSLTPIEYNFVFEITPPPQEVVPDIILDSGFTFQVVNRILPSRVYFIVKNIVPNFLLEPLQYYTFDLSDPSNLNTQFCLSEVEYSGIPYKGIRYESTPGTPGAKLILSVQKDINAYELFTFNSLEPLPTMKYSWGYSTKSIIVHLANTIAESVTEYSYLDARQYSLLSIYESYGPKFSINDVIYNTVFLEFNQYHYNFTYGTYYLDIPKTYASTLLNKGYESFVSFVGDEDKKIIDTVTDISLAPGNLQEGLYAFYYGRVKMSVYKPFPVDMSIYSRSFGFLGGISLFHFSDALPTQDTVYSLPYTNTLKAGAMIRINDVENKKYGLSMGSYAIQIDSSKSVAFLTKGKEDVFSIVKTSSSVETGPFMSPDGTAYYFYTGRINLHIKGYFETLSMCTRDGYSGGFKLLVYNAYHCAPSQYIYTSNSTMKGLCAQNTFNLLNNQFIAFNDDYSQQKYGLYKGVYTIFNIPKNCPITLLNKGKESLVKLEGLEPGSTYSGTGPDGQIYTFYYGILRFTVYGNFGKMSLYSLFSGYMGCLGIFEYNALFSNHISYPDALSVPTIVEVIPSTLFSESEKQVQYVSLKILTKDGIDVENTVPYSLVSDGTLYTAIYNIVNITTTLSFNSEPYNVMNKFILKNGIYIFDSNQYIALLNKGAESNIQMIGVLSKPYQVASDGNTYTYYKGDNIVIYVYGNFVMSSLEVLGGPVGKFIFYHQDNILP